ncbi:hypothetical protein J7J90_01875 [Candidatus Micrarchaeota archaeon]|nr:hypothetical protein [Candidatus Micrarchaeota archaeon]
MKNVLRMVVLSLFILLAIFNTQIITGSGVPTHNQKIQTCNQTADCVQGYCENNECVIPIVNKETVAECNQTADCVQGYCENNECVIPKGEELSKLLWLKSGCSGLFVCPESDILCFFLCNMIWLILIVLSLLAGYDAKDYENKLIPFIYLVLPLGIGLFSVPVAGVIVSVIEIVSIHYDEVKPLKEYIQDIQENYISYLSPIKKKNKK